MSEKIEKIVDVTISRETRSISRQGFGTPLILGPNGPGGMADYEVREYTSIDGVATDYADTTDEYKAANALFSQQPRVRNLKIAKQAAYVKETWTLTFDADLITGNSVLVTIDGVACAAVPFNGTHNQTMTDLAAAIAAHASVDAASVTAARVITFTAIKAGVPIDPESVVVSGGASQADGAFANTVLNVGITKALNEIVLNDNDWYGLLITERDKDFVLQAAAWTEAQYKIFFTVSEDSNIYNAASTTDIAYLLSDLNYDRSCCSFNEDVDDWLDAGWLGRGLPYDPGSITWMFKSVAGASASDSLTETQITAIKNKNCNVYTKIANIAMMEWGWMASGEYIDVIHGIDWIRARMQEEIFGKLVNAKKIPYTDAGIAIIEAQIRAVLENAMKKGVIAPAPELFDGQDYLVEVPKVADISDNDKAARLLPDVTWQARLAGAIHKVIIQGRVQV